MGAEAIGVTIIFCSFFAEGRLRHSAIHCSFVRSAVSGIGIRIWAAMFAGAVSISRTVRALDAGALMKVRHKNGVPRIACRKSVTTDPHLITAAQPLKQLRARRISDILLQIKAALRLINWFKFEEKIAELCSVGRRAVEMLGSRLGS
jgi:hypothetical protein